MAKADEVDPYENLFKNPGEDAFTKLFRSELYFMVPLTYCNEDAKIAWRNSAIQLIETIYPRTTHAYDPLIPYTAITYFDRFYSQNDDFPLVLHHRVDTRNRTLFVICCLTIAWKLRDKNFLLPDFLNKKELLYSTDDVRKMELQICRGLDWRMRSVTPFLFLGFFIRYLEQPVARSRVHDLISISQREKGDLRSEGATRRKLLAHKIYSECSFCTSESKDLLRMLTYNVKHLRDQEVVISPCTLQLLRLYKSIPDIDELPTDLAPGPGPSPDQKTNESPPVQGPSSDQTTKLEPGGQSSAGSSKTLTEERPRRRPGKEPVTELGQIQQGPDQKKDPDAVTKKADDDNTSTGKNAQALEQDTGEIKAAAADQGDQTNQITEQAAKEEADDSKEKELALDKKSANFPCCNTM
ncbi:hypothetical protein CASFOL_007478 [Castilleja foliolosa]|uniref:Cyclin N-terminal domain-containing protein n=1 Tax=Castilleja foliolosa TaxID=1961234 RepID=A0ABD3E9C1_9LAMI